MPAVKRYASPVLPPRARWRSQWTAAAVAAVVMVVAGCGGPQPASSRSEASTGAKAAAAGSSAAAVTEIAVRPAIEHVHGLVVQDSTVLAGTHEGLFRVSADGTATRVGSVRDDLMGLSASIDGRLLASGHPGAGSTTEDPLGLVSSQDAGLTWTPIPTARRADYHALAVDGQMIASWDGSRVRVSTDAGLTWRDGVNRDVWSLSVGGDSVWATGPDGLTRSTDQGLTFTGVAGAPRLALATAADAGGPRWGIDADGTVWVRDRASGWGRVATIPARRAISAITAVDAGTAYIAVDDHLVRVTLRNQS